MNKSFEDVELLSSNLSAVDIVEDLHVNERAEYVCQQSLLCLRTPIGLARGSEGGALCSSSLSGIDITLGTWRSYRHVLIV